jgi:2-keto-4-pentenoate hydratase
LAGLDNDTIQTLARELLEAEHTRRVLRPLTESHPGIDVNSAYAIQLELIERKKANGAAVVGKKIGLTSRAMQKMLNVDQPDYGHILDAMMLEDGARMSTEELIQPKVEAEIAFVLDRELKGPGVTPLQVLSATRFVLPAIEIIDSRIEGWRIKLPDTIADNASSGRVVLGGPPRQVTQLDLRLVGMILELNGDVVQTGAGAAVLGHPANAVAWLANALGGFGVSLGVGEVIMPGALSAAVDVTSGDLVRVCFDRLGTVSVRFA